MTDEVLAAVREAWGWTGAEPVAIFSVSRFGHLVVEERDGGFRYLDPEMGTFDRIAGSYAELEAWTQDRQNMAIWLAERLVTIARQRLGDPADGYCFSLVPEALIDGDYAAENLRTVPIDELIRFTGDFERQIHDMPDGGFLQVKVRE